MTFGCAGARRPLAKGAASRPSRDSDALLRRSRVRSPRCDAISKGESMGFADETVTEHIERARRETRASEEMPMLGSANKWFGCHLRRV